MRSISDLLENSALKTPKKPAIIFNDSVYTYDDILKKSELLSNYLQEKIPSQNVVSILCENSVDFIISYFGILKSGLVAHIIPPNISDRNLIEQINETDSKLIFASKNFNGKIKRTNLKKITNFSINELCALQKYSNDFRGNNFCETSSIIFTSGTTSKPKGVKLQHKNILTATSNIVDILDMNHDDVEINSLSLSHSFGLGCIHANFMVGSTSLIFRNTINTDEILTKGKEFFATGFVGVPNTFYRILDLNKKLFSSIPSLRYLLTNTSPMRPEKVLEIIDLLPKTKFYTYYGLTEASRSTFLLFNDNIKKINSVGKPPNNVQVSIIDDDGNQMLSNQIGEVCIKGDHVIEEYWNNPKANRQLNDGWLKTGDIGFIDLDGFLFLKSRKDDLINVSGEKFSPEEIEMIINQIPEVLESVVVGIPDENFGQLPIAFVVKSGDHKAKEIIDFCSTKIERYKLPTKVFFLDTIPKTDSGKIKRNELKSKFIA